MPALIRELLLDYAQNRLHVDLRSDLTIAIQSAISSSVFTRQDIEYLDKYLAGYTAEEIAIEYIKYTEDIEIALQRIFTAIEQYSGYTDANFIRKLELTKKYRKNGIDALNTFLTEHGKHYITHELEVR